jgi:hypothetical protein
MQIATTCLCVSGVPGKQQERRDHKDQSVHLDRLMLAFAALRAERKRLFAAIKCDDTKERLGDAALQVITLCLSDGEIHMSKGLRPIRVP